MADRRAEVALELDHSKLLEACKQRETALQDAAKKQQLVEAQKQQLVEAQKALRVANERVTKQEETISTTLKSLSSRIVTIASLHHTQVGKTVKKLSTCDVSKIAEASAKLVISWKKIIDKLAHAGAKMPASARPSMDSSAPPVSRALPHTPSRSATNGRSDVLDSVRDIYGRVERRIADPDCPEDQLALTEAAEAERMWEEQMGREGTAGHSSGGSSRLEAVVNNLKARYQQIDEEKQKRKIGTLQAQPIRGDPRKRPASTPIGRHGKDPRRL